MSFNRRILLKSAATLAGAAWTEHCFGLIHPMEHQSVSGDHTPPSIVDLSAASSAAQQETHTFDLAAVPFSYAGSFLSSELVESPRGRSVRFSTVRRSAATYRYQSGAWSSELFEIDLLQDGKPVQYDVQASPESLLLRADGCQATVRFASRERLLLAVRGATLQLRLAHAFSWRRVENERQIQGYDNPAGYIFTCVAGPGSQVTYTRSTPETIRVGAGSGVAAGAQLDLIADPQDPQIARPGKQTAPPVPPPVLSKEPSFAEWMSLCPEDTSSETAHATRIAWYLFWALRVEPSGGYTRRTVLSSKRSLNMIWSWDNLFNAMALVHTDAPLAWEQLHVILDHQLPNGVLPDAVSDAGCAYGFRKPPLWAWAAQKLLAATPAAERESRLRAVYPSIARYHRWWFRERDLRGNGIPAYLNGNDSGWDNASVFAEGWPVESPDLLALLCLDADELSQCAEQLGLGQEARDWRQESERLLERFHKHFQRGEDLVVHVLDPAGARTVPSTSLLTRIPILLGHRLSPELQRSLVRDLADPAQFAAPAGPATESLSSPLYESNGYWRGPVWGPSTLLICEGLRRLGKPEPAASFARRYRATCAQRADFRENYDARTGEGRYDTGMTWSAADFLLLASFFK